METISKIIISGLIGLASLFGYQQQPTNLSASLPQGAAIFETSLQSAITSSASSMTLAANSVRGGSTLSGYNCFTIDEGSSQAEYVCGTVSGTTVSSLTRGIDPLTGTTTTSSLQFAHRRGANVKITDYPLIQIMRNQLNGSETIPNLLKYTYDQDFTSATTSALVTYGQLTRTAFAGVSDATESVKGISELATQIEMASSTSVGGTSAFLVLQSKYATSSPYTTGLYVPITRNDGKLSPLFIATTSSDTYNFGGQVNLNASTTLTSTTTIAASSGNKLSLNSVPYVFPSSQGSSNTALVNNGSGTLSWTTLNSNNLIGTTTGVTVTNSTTETIMASTTVTGGTLSTGNSVIMEIPVSDWQTGGANPSLTLRVKYGGTTIYSVTYSPTTLSGVEGKIKIRVSGNGSTSSQHINWEFNLDSRTVSSTNASMYDTNFTTSSVDSTTDKSLTLTAQFSGNTTGSFATDNGIVYIIR